MTPSLVLRPRPEQQPLLVGFVILLVLSVVLPLAGFGTDSFGDVGAWIAFGLACLAVARPLRSRIVVPEGRAMSLDNATFSNVTALYAWNRYLGVCDAGKHEADVSRLMRLLSYTYLTPDPGMPPRVRLSDASSAEVSQAAAALLDAGAQIRLERPRAPVTGTARSGAALSARPRHRSDAPRQSAVRSLAWPLTAPWHVSGRPS